MCVCVCVCVCERERERERERKEVCGWVGVTFMEFSNSVFTHTQGNLRRPGSLLVCP